MRGRVDEDLKKTRNIINGRCKSSESTFPHWMLEEGLCAPLVGEPPRCDLSYVLPALVARYYLDAITEEWIKPRIGSGEEVGIGR